MTERREDRREAGRADLAQQLEAERRRVRDLERECARLGAEVGRLRGTIEEARHAVGEIFESWSSRRDGAATRTAARLTGRQAVLPGRSRLEALLGVDADEAAAIRQYARPARHAEEATADHFLLRTPTPLLAEVAPPERRPRIGLGGIEAPQLAEAFEVTGLEAEGLEAAIVAVDAATTAAALDALLARDVPVIAILAEPPAAELEALLDRCFAVAAAGRFEHGAEIVRLTDDGALLRLAWAACNDQSAWVPPLFEHSYLAQYPDVLAAVRDGEVSSASEHWEAVGRAEFLAGWRDYRPALGSVSAGLREADEELAATCAAEIEDWEHPPRLSVLMPIHRVDLPWLEAAVSSVRDQLYPHWELVMVDDASGSAEITAFLERAAEHPAIEFRSLEHNVGIAGATNVALEAASGEHVVLLDHDDELALDALWLVARVIRDHDPDIVYSDEAKLTMEGEVTVPHFKPGFSPEQIRAQNYISHLGVYRRDLLAAIGGFRPGYEGAQDHDLLLRALGEARAIFHIPRILYYWRMVPGSTAANFSAKSHAWDAGVKAIGDQLEDAGIDARAERGPFPGTTHVTFAVPHPPRVSVIVPFRDQPALLRQCFDGLLKRTDYPDLEIIGVDNGSADPETKTLRTQLEADPRVRFLDWNAPFNFSALNNAAAAVATGAHLLLLNNDIGIIERDWMTALVEHSQRPGVGAVGARLRYPDGTLQHAGVIVGLGGAADHSHKHLGQQEPGYFGRPHLIQTVSAVTGACLMVERRLYRQLGGLDEANLGIAYNDIDFCLRLVELGYRNVYTPKAYLVHMESKSRGAENTPEKRERLARERDWLRQRHRRIFSLGDPHYSPNLTLSGTHFGAREALTP